MAHKNRSVIQRRTGLPGWLYAWIGLGLVIAGLIFYQARTPFTNLYSSNTVILDIPPEIISEAQDEQPNIDLTEDFFVASPENTATSDFLKPLNEQADDANVYMPLGVALNDRDLELLEQELVESLVSQLPDHPLQNEETF